MTVPPWERRKRLRVAATTWLNHARINAEASREAILHAAPALSAGVTDMSPLGWKDVCIEAAALTALLSPEVLAEKSPWAYYQNVIYHVVRMYSGLDEGKLAESHRFASGVADTPAGVRLRVGLWLQREMTGTSGLDVRITNAQLLRTGAHFVSAYETWFKIVAYGFDLPRATAAELKMDAASRNANPAPRTPRRGR